MVKRIEQHFTSDDLDRIQTAVAGAEKETSGEIAVKLATHTKHWLEERLLYSALVAALAVILSLTLTIRSDWGLTYNITQAIIWGVVGFVLCFFVAGRWLTRQSRRRLAVWKRALKLFSRMPATKGQTGVLIYVSLEERQAAIVADKKIAAKVPANYWHEPQGMIMESLGKSNGTDGIIAAVADIGYHLKTHFPHRDDDKNEIPDRPEVL